MDTTTSAQTNSDNKPIKKTPEPGTNVFIARGDFGGEVATVGALVAPQQAFAAGNTLNVIFSPPVVFDGVHIIAAFVNPADVTPVPSHLEEGAPEPTEYDTSKVDPWLPQIAVWLHSLEGESYLASGELTTSIVIERALQVNESFFITIRVARLMRELGYELQEKQRGQGREWFWMPVNGLVDTAHPLPERKRYEAQSGNSAGLVLALATFITWLRAGGTNIERLGRFATTMLETSRGKLRSHSIDYFEWVAKGVSLLDILAKELHTQAIVNPSNLLCSFILGQASGQHGGEESEIVEFHRAITHILVNGGRWRRGIDEPIEKSDRNGEINGWIDALSKQAQIARELAQNTNTGQIKMPDGSDKNAVVLELEAQARALEWIVEAVGGEPGTNEAKVVPMVELVEMVELSNAGISMAKIFSAIESDDNFKSAFENVVKQASKNKQEEESPKSGVLRIESGEEAS